MNDDLINRVMNSQLEKWEVWVSFVSNLLDSLDFNLLTTKEQLDESDFVKIKNFCSVFKILLRTVQSTVNENKKINHKMWEIICKI